MFGWWRKSKRSKFSQALPLDAALFDGEGEPLYNAVAAYRSASDKAFTTSQNAMPEVQALEDRYTLRLPEDFRSYLLYAAPATLWMDDIGTQWWAARDIKSIADECPEGSPGKLNADIERESAQYLVFADYLMWCYAWAICCSEGHNRGKIALIGGAPDMFVADSFRDFLKLEMGDALEIHGGPNRKRTA